MTFLLRVLRCFGHQHWIPRGRDRVIRLLANPDKMKPIPFTLPFFGQVYDGTLSNFIDWSVYFYGAYSRYELDLLADLCALSPPDRRPRLLDVGANGGHHTLFMASRCERVDAFEPFPPAVALLKSRLLANGIGNCHVHAVGLADRNGRAVFVPPAGANPGVGHFDLDLVVDDGDETGPDALRLVQGDAYLEACGVPPVDILKIDVEGAEASVLSGLFQRLRNDRPAILMELSDRSRTAFQNEDGLRAGLYPDAVILSVLPVSISGTYRLSKFDFQRSLEILIVPAESLLRHDIALIGRIRRLLAPS